MRRLGGYVAFAMLMLSGIGIVTVLRILRVARNERLESADAIVVFGAAVWERGPSTTLRLRTARAAELYRRGLAPIVLCSGGTSGGRSEPRVMADLLAAEGVPESAVVIDEAGVNTHATVRSIVELGRGQWHTVLAVSSPFHLFRIIEECRRHGVEALPCSAARPRSSGRSAPAKLRLMVWDARQYGRETVAVWAYRLLAWRARGREVA